MEFMQATWKMNYRVEINSIVMIFHLKRYRLYIDK